MSDIIYLSNVRLSFPHIAEPQRKVNEVTGTEKISYNCEFIMPESHEGFRQFMARYAAMAQEKWKENASTVMQMIQMDRKTRCYGQGIEKVNKKSLRPYDGYEGNVFITAGSERQPQVIQANGQPVDPKNSIQYLQVARQMYGGCRVNAAIKPWIQQNKFGNGIRCDLIAIQFAGDDKPFGEGAPDVSSMFGVVGTQAAAQPSAAPAMPMPPFMGGQ